MGCHEGRKLSIKHIATTNDTTHLETVDPVASISISSSNTGSRHDAEVMAVASHSAGLCASGRSRLGAAERPAARQSGLDQEVLWPRDLQGAVEEPLRGPQRRPALHL